MDELRQTIVTAVNNSNLPIDAVYYVMKDIWRDVYEMHESALKNASTKQSLQLRLLRKNND